MNPFRFRLLVAWNIALSVALLVAVLGVLASAAQAANDPPVKVFTASYAHGNGIRGGGAGSRVINSTAYQDILTIPVNFTGQSHTHQCAIIASANVTNPSISDTGNVYRFGIGLDGASAATYSFSEMVVELNDNATIDDPSWVPVTTNRLFTSLSAGPHTLRFQARKNAASNPNLTVNNAYATVICLKRSQESAATTESEPAAPDTLPDSQ